MDEKLLMIFTSVDWVFAGVILIGGRYWGSNFFKISGNSSVNFLVFATLFGIVFLFIKYYTIGIGKGEIVNLFITYLLVTSFYDLLAKGLFRRLEDLFLPKNTRHEKAGGSVRVNAEG